MVTFGLVLLLVGAVVYRTTSENVGGFLIAVSGVLIAVGFLLAGDPGQAALVVPALVRPHGYA